MFMTPVEYQAMIQKNPALRARVNKMPAKIAELIADSCKGNKYWNDPVFVQEKGVSIKKQDEKLGKVLEKYDSLKEYSRYQQLLVLQRVGQISELKRQVPLLIQEAFKYQGKKVLPIVYVADFTYHHNGGDVEIVEDVKAFDEKTQKYKTTKDFNLKWKLLKFRYPQLSFELF